MQTSREFDAASLEKFRAYLNLVACTHVDARLRQHLDASDVVQQTMLDAVARQGQFRGGTESEFVAWLRKILTRNLVDLVRYHGRDKRDAARVRSLDDEITDSFRRIDALADSCSSPSSRAATNDQLLRLPAALDALPDGQRDAIVLHHLQGLKLSETARRMGRSESAVGGLLRRGFKRLHDILEE